MYDEEPQPLSPAQLRNDYYQTLNAFDQYLESNPALVVKIGDGVNIYAATVPALSEYGGRKEDDRLLLVVTETTMEETGAKVYGVSVTHYGEKPGEVFGEDTTSYSTDIDFNEDDMEEYDPDLADQVRRMLEYAHEYDRFDYDEARFWANCYFDSPTMRASLNGQRRGERRTRQALVDLLVSEIYAEQLRHPAS